MSGIVGLDLSLTATGFADADGAYVVKCAKQTSAARLAHFRDHFKSVFDDNKPDLVVVEGYSFGSHTAGSRSIGELGGVIRLLLWDLQIPWAEVPPSVLKKFATGKGNASKDQVLSAAVRLDPSIDDNNAADAFWLRELGVSAKGYPSGKAVGDNKYREEAIKKVVWP